jgi:YVTN family beta-propeller protein
MNWLKRSMTVGAVAASMLLQGCQPPSTGAVARSSGSLALSSDDSLLYAVDRDNGTLNVIDTQTNLKRSELKVGAEPVRVLVGSDDTIYVANRGSRSVSVIRKGETSVSQTLAVGVEPTGLALAHGGKTLLVTSSTALDTTETGLLTAFDTATLQPKWELKVGEEPRAVAVLNGDRALVTLFKTGVVVEVDLNAAKVTNADIGINQAANASAGGTNSFGSFSTFKARGLNDLVVTPDGSRAFTPVVWARQDAISKRPNSSGGYYASGGPCNIGAVATAGIVTIDTTGAATPKVDDLTACSSRGTTSANLDFPTSALAPSDGSFPVQGATVSTVDSSGAFVFVINRESKNLAVLPTGRRTGDDLRYESTGTSVRDTVDVGNGADGIALSANGHKAYVYNQFDHSVSVIGKCEQAGSCGDKAVGQLYVQTTISGIASELLSNELALGRRLFYDATDTRMSSAQTVVACSTCHLEGREDGHVWQFPDGPRQTPALAGRHLLATAPYHWSGEFDSLPKFNTHTITERMGGSGLDDLTASHLDDYIDQLPLPDNGLRTGSPDVVARGRVAFEKASCNTCHAGALLTNNTNAQVGTLDTAIANPDNGVVVTNGFNVPSLLGVGRSAPYLHDGSERTLEARVFADSSSQHGNLTTLSTAEKNDLVTYLKSL